MREILFRGKDIRQNWHIGLLAHIGNAWYISNKAGIATAFEVIPETVGQYTGLTDKNDKKIFEGDIVKWIIQYEREEGLHRVEGIDKVIYDAPLFVLKEETGFTLAFDNNEAFALEVIGNIHDNPELLRSEQE